MALHSSKAHSQTPSYAIDSAATGTGPAQTADRLLPSPRENCGKPPRIGGAGRDRTDGLLLAKQALSQLSYSPVNPSPLTASRPQCSRRAAPVCPCCSLILVGLDGFEPSTPALSRRCSNQLSYRPARVAIASRHAIDRLWVLNRLRSPEQVAGRIAVPCYLTSVT